MSKTLNNVAKDYANGSDSGDLSTIAQSVLLWESAVIDGLATGATILVPATTVNRYLAVSLAFAIRLISVSGAGTVPSLSIGNNGASYNNLLTATALTGLTTSNDLLVIPPTTPKMLNLNAAGVYVNVTVAAVVFTAYTFQVLLYGVLRDS